MSELSEIVLRLFPWGQGASVRPEWIGIIAGASIALAGLASSFLPAYRSRRRSQVERRHRRMQAAARRALSVLDQIEHGAQKLAYLRTLEPFVFEELLLDAYARRGHSIRRNRRYTADGGVDGRVFIDGQLFLIQAKRYSGHINPTHVQEFRQTVRQRRCRGMFCHTGRTGPSARRIFGEAPEITLLSGDALLRLLAPPVDTQWPIPLGTKPKRRKADVRAVPEQGIRHKAPSQISPSSNRDCGRAGLSPAPTKLTV